MKILHIVRQFYPAIGGLEKYVFQLANQQKLNGYDVTILTLNKVFNSSQKLQKNETLTNGILILRIPYFFSKKYPVAFNSFRHLKKHDIIIVHAVDFFADFIALTKIFHKKKTILITHGGFFHTKWGYILKKVYFQTITRLTVNTYDKIIGCSENDIELFNKITKKIILIKNGIDTEPFLQTPKNKIKGNLLYVGRLDYHKRIDLLIKLTAYLIKNGQNVSLTIVGPDTAGIGKKLMELTHKLNITEAVIFVGVVNEKELINAYSKADLFLSASEYEGFGLTSIEALSCGTPCVLSNIKSFREILEDKPFGVITNFNDIKEAGSKVIDFLRLSNEDYLMLEKKARQYSKTYDWKFVESQFDEIIKKLIIQ